MNYGLYLSATGVLANSHRQDVIANNLANSETVGFKRDLALFQERLTEAQSRGLLPPRTDAEMEKLGGGLLLSPTRIDLSQGDMEHTGNPLDVALAGSGFFAVSAGDKNLLTRDGRFLMDRSGRLITAGSGHAVLDAERKPIVLDPSRPVKIGADGSISQGEETIAKLGLFEPSGRLTKRGGGLLESADGDAWRTSSATAQSEWVERANLDPATELTALMETQRHLEANANLIRYQDQMLGKLVNEVGRIG